MFIYTHTCIYKEKETSKEKHNQWSISGSSKRWVALIKLIVRRSFFLLTLFSCLSEPYKRMPNSNSLGSFCLSFVKNGQIYDE